MGLRTPAEYLESLKDGRTVYYRGERVDDVTTHPVISKAAKHACVDYEMAEEPEFKDLTIIDDEDEPYARYFKVPEEQRRPAQALTAHRGLHRPRQDPRPPREGESAAMPSSASCALPAPSTRPARPPTAPASTSSTATAATTT